MPCKAFMLVLGESGLVMNNRHIIPYPIDPMSVARDQTLIELGNDHQISVHNKRFIFVYPLPLFRQPCETPARTPRRKLRMSMIQSADVFSPRPSRNPMVNLMILKSPVKGRLAMSPVKNRTETPTGEKIILVDGN